MAADAQHMTQADFYKAANEKPDGAYIEIFCSDWNKEHWTFYYYIDQDNYEEDISKCNELIDQYNWRDGDVYVELIDHSEDLTGFYKYLYDLNSLAHWKALDPEYWDILDERGDSHFQGYNALRGTGTKDEIRDFECCFFNDWDEVLETYYPELAEALDKANAWGSFDSESFFYGCSFAVLNTGIILDCEA